jgi:hypothetical protein
MITSRKPMTPEGPGPKDREYGQVGSTPIRSRIRIMTMTVVTLMNEAVDRRPASRGTGRAGTSADCLRSLCGRVSVPSSTRGRTPTTEPSKPKTGVRSSCPRAGSQTSSSWRLRKYFIISSWSGFPASVQTGKPEAGSSVKSRPGSNWASKWCLWS